MNEAGFFAPGRVNLIGEHLDYNGGRCLPIALAVGTTCSVRRAARNRFASVQRGDSAWTVYVEGVLSSLRADGVDVPPLDLVVDSGVPVGAGLASSAALTCSVTLAALWAANVPAYPHAVVRVARSAEAFAGAPTGGLDQSAAMYATARHALLLDFETGGRHQVPWEHPVLVIDTRVRHAHNDGRYAERRAQCEAAARLLGVRHLALARSWTGLDGVLARRARHVVTEMRRVQEVVLGDRGAAFTASHASLRDDFEVSCPELDVAVEAALEAGALGARLTGGGFGGSAIALLPGEDRGRVRAAVEDAFGRSGWAAPAFLEASASGGARQVSG